jgi:hypothetical protein
MYTIAGKKSLEHTSQDVEGIKEVERYQTYLLKLLTC